MSIKNLLRFCRREEKAITNYVFGATSSIVTSLALIIGLNTSSNPKLAIISSLLIIALADNISDSLGIHIYQESQGMTLQKVWLKTGTNFFTRLLISSGFIGIVTVFPITLATYIAVVYGLTILSVFSYFIAIDQNKKPVFSILEHLCIAIFVIILSRFIGSIIVRAV